MSKISQNIANFKNKRIVVVGDIMLDHYVHGAVTRISPEAPVAVLKKTADSYTFGGAGNVAYNAKTLGAQVFLCGVIGSDNAGKKIIDLLKEKNINSDGVVQENNRPTTVKKRFISGNQQLLRVDDETDSPILENTEKKIIEHLHFVLPSADAVILSDYSKGFFNKNLAKKIINLAKENNKPIIADFKPVNKSFFYGVDVLTPNLKEAKEMSGQSTRENAAQAIAKEFNATTIVTLAADGVIVGEAKGTVTHIPSRKIKVYDVSGAGDTVTAVVALAWACGISAVDVATLANYGGELVVQKPGTATITAEELISRVGQDKHTAEVNIVPKVWGYEKWLENNDKYCSKLLVINRGFQCSLHYHKIKDEMFLVTKGHVRAELDGEIIYMKPGNFIRVEPGKKHRFRGLEDSEMLEISTHHDESDSYRLEESRAVSD